MKKLSLFIIGLFLSVAVMAQPPQKFNYQGVARMANGSPITSQSISLKISILEGSSSGSPVYVETHKTTTNQFGLYNVAIGGGTVVSGTISGVNWGSGDKYVKVEIDPQGGTSYTSLGAAQLLSVPYAIYAGSTAASGTSPVNGTANYLVKFGTATTGVNSGIIESSGSIGVGVTSPQAKMHLVGSVSSSLTLGGNTFDHNGLVEQTSTTSTTGNSRAIVGYAVNSSTENQGVLGYANGTSSSSSNVGVFALGTSASTTTGNNFGVYGNASNGANNIGVLGASPNSSSTDLAGYFNGNVSINGTLAKSSGTFKIDHPLDPENKYLYHSFVESPDMMNVYNGNVTTDGNGLATVTMPDYFEALNKDFRYQLTVMGVFAQAIIAEKIQGNKFVIKTDKPNVEVSWQVTGIRHDKYADAHRVVPEVEKEDQFKGYYISPKEFGKPETQGIGYKLMPESAKKMKK